MMMMMLMDAWIIDRRALFIFHVWLSCICHMTVSFHLQQHFPNCTLTQDSLLPGYRQAATFRLTIW